MQKPLTIDVYKRWLTENKHAGMNYLNDHLRFKENPKAIDPKLKSVFVFSFDYLKGSLEPHPWSPLKIAKYAKHPDYHLVLKELLSHCQAGLEDAYPTETFVSFVDSGPVLERDLAYQAGLGWIGKNTMLIHPKKGSFSFIATIFCSVDCPEKSITPVHDFCGNCNRCIEACPTQALTVRELDANKCISYWNIESRDIAKPDLRARFSDRFFGCDICQDVCPWNQKVLTIYGATAAGADAFESDVPVGESAGTTDFSGTVAVPPIESPAIETSVTGTSVTENLAIEKALREILTSSNQKLQKTVRLTPLSRAGGFGLKRNALYVAENLGIKNLLPEIKSLTQSENPKLQKLAQEVYDKLSL